MFLYNLCPSVFSDLSDLFNLELWELVKPYFLHEDCPKKVTKLLKSSTKKRELRAKLTYDGKRNLLWQKHPGKAEFHMSPRYLI